VAPKAFFQCLKYTHQHFSGMVTGKDVHFCSELAATAGKRKMKPAA
jgi:hypothetical protein